MSKQLDFIKRFTPIAKEVSAKYRIPYGALIAQAALETGWGTSEVCLKANNYFGTKSRSSEGAFNQGGVFYVKFLTPEESFMYQGWQLSVPRYETCKKYLPDLKKYFDCVQAAGYCAAPVAGGATYGDKISEIAAQWGLDVDEDELAKAFVEGKKIMRPYGDKDKYWANMSSRKEIAVLLYRLSEYIKGEVKNG